MFVLEVRKTEVLELSFGEAQVVSMRLSFPKVTPDLVACRRRRRRGGVGKAGLARLEFTEKMQHFPRGLHKTSAPHTLLHHSAPTNRVSVELPLEGIFTGVEASTPLPGSA